MNEYWLTIEPYVYFTIKNNKVLLYNTYSKNSLVFDDEIIINKIHQLKNENKISVISISEEDLKNKQISSFIKLIRENYMGDIIDKKLSVIKPVQMEAASYIETDIEKIKDAETIKGKNIKENLTEITLYLNNQCNQNCKICNQAYKQFLYCTKEISGNYLSFTEIEKFLKKKKLASMAAVNLIGGDLLQYPYLDKLIEYLKNEKAPVHLYINYLNYKPGYENFSCSINILANIDNPDSFEDYILKNKTYQNYKYTFIVQDNEQFNKIEKIIEKYGIENFIFIPLYNHKNMEFFKQNVFLTNEDVENSGLNMKEILRNQKINANNFGKLTILPNGDIHGNINTPSLGNIKTNALDEIIFKELEGKNSWRNTRESDPCNQCVYQYLCPPPSNYEYVLGKTNLCNVQLNEELSCLKKEVSS